MTYKNEKQLIEFYKQCIENEYTDMRDDRQSLKAKVIAMDLGLDYKSISELFASAKICYENACLDAERKSVDGSMLLEVMDGQNEKQTKKRIVFYQRPDGSIYHVVNGNGEKIEGSPKISIKDSAKLSFSYKPSRTIYTGAAAGGIAMGGFHQTHAQIKERLDKSQKAYVQIDDDEIGFEIWRIRLSDEMKRVFRRSDAMKHMVSGEIQCFQEGGVYAQSMKDGMAMKVLNDYHSMMTHASYALDEMRLPASDVAAIYELVVNVLEGNYPPDDQQVYEEAVNIYQTAKTSKELGKAAKMLKGISDYHQGARELYGTVNAKYKEVQQKEKEEFILRQEAKEKAKKKKRPILFIIGIILIGIIAAAAFVIENNKKNTTYDSAISSWNQGRKVEAVQQFNTISNYKDSQAYITSFEQEIIGQLTMCRWKTGKITSKDSNNGVEGTFYYDFNADGTCVTGFKGVGLGKRSGDASHEYNYYYRIVIDSEGVKLRIGSYSSLNSEYDNIFIIKFNSSEIASFSGNVKVYDTVHLIYKP